MYSASFGLRQADERERHAMIRVEPISVGPSAALGIEVKLPKTTLLVITTDKGYIMCGALDVQLLNERLTERKIIAGRALGVRTLQDLWEAPLESVTVEAENIGITAGMKGKDAIRIMLQK